VQRKKTDEYKVAIVTMKSKCTILIFMEYCSIYYWLFICAHHYYYFFFFL